MSATVDNPPTKLLNRNYLLQWQGQSVSRLGSQAFSIAMLLWIKDATGSAALMGLLQMLSSLPAVLLGPIGGAIADRYSRRNIIILSDLLRGIVVIGLSGLLFTAPDATDTILVVLFVTSMLVTVVNSFFGPAISASIPDLVPKAKVATANSMGQLSIQLAVFIGQGIGGTLFRLLGAPIIFLINGVTYLFAAFSESFVVIPQRIPEKSKDFGELFQAFKEDLQTGFRYVWNRTGLRELVLLSAMVSFFTAPVVILLPFYIEDTLGLTVDWYGFMLASYGIGTLMGYLFAGAVQMSSRMRGSLTLLFMIVQGAGYVLLGFNQSGVWALLLALAGGFGGGYVTVNITTILQLTSPGEMRGRVFGLLTALSGSLTPVAMGLAGIVADLLDQNIPLIYIICGVIMLAVTLMVAVRKEVRDFLAYEVKEESLVEVEEPFNPLV